MMIDGDARAADQLEELLPHLRALVNEIREGHVDAYGNLYEARRRLGKIVNACYTERRATRWHDWGD